MFLLAGCDDLHLHLVDDAVNGLVDTADSALVVNTADTSETGDTADTGTRSVEHTWTAAEPTQLQNQVAASGGWLFLQDVDNDGALDLVLVRTDAAGRPTVSRWPVGAGGLGALEQEQLSQTGMGGFTLGDIDGDGTRELVGNVGAAGVVAYGFSEKGLVERARVALDGLYLQGVTLVDLDADGAAEWVMVGQLDGALAIAAVNLVTGTMTKVSGRLPVSAFATFAGENPLLHQPAALLSAAGPEGAHTWTLTMDAQGALQLDDLGLTGGASSAYFVTTLDTNVDGHAELLSTGPDGLFAWNPVDGNAEHVRGEYGVTPGATLTVADVNGDGADDEVELFSHNASTDHSSSQLANIQAGVSGDDGVTLGEAAEFDLGPPYSVGPPVLVAGEMTGDGCVDLVFLDVSLVPWLSAGTCRAVSL